MKQLSFPLPHSPRFGLEDFFVSPANKAALTAIKRDWIAQKLILVGPAGAGKSHLAAIWADEKEAKIIKANALDQACLRLGVGDYVVVEDVGPGLGQDFEAALFHLHNLAARPRGGLLITAQSKPLRWGVALPDLKSRLEATEIVALGPPDDALLTAVLAKAFTDRQLAPSPNLLRYIVKRMERSLSHIIELVEQLDQRALERGQAISLKLVQEFFRAEP